ncbi:aromatic-L-amino-acid decarboxylase-like [Atheta coriaria]|uniref:aromatic-L-amino-acid decarboxylase-like n=1 Tax=Dalotia coriaria TaxID=877792 RepID=UPI0031F34902
MEKNEFLQAIEKVSSFIVNYLETVGEKNVLPGVQPGYLTPLTEEECPKSGTNFEDIFTEFREKIMPGVTHWASPHFHAYFPAGNCYPSMVAELMMAGINNVGVNWEASPAMTELETVVLNWLGKMMNIPEEFLNSSDGHGGGVFQNTSTESTLLSCIAARKATIDKWLQLRPNWSESQISSKLTIYTSIQSHSSVERVGSMTALITRIIPCNEEGKVTAEILQSAIESDIAQGLIPCFYVATMGATTTCSWDDLSEVGPVCEAHDVWMHVDAAYAGAALTCPELRYISNGLDYAKSFAVGLHKWFLMSFDVVAYWLKDTTALSDVMYVDRVYLKHNHNKGIDFTHLQIGNGRKFKALKVWMTLKSFGVKGVQEHIRRSVMLGQYFEKLMTQDKRFRIATSGFGLVVFALKTGDEDTEELRRLINEDKKIMLTPAHYLNKYVIRFAVNHSTRSEDVEFAWDVIRSTTNRMENTYKKSESVDVLIENVGDYLSTIEI